MSFPNDLPGNMIDRAKKLARQLAQGVADTKWDNSFRSSSVMNRSGEVEMSYMPLNTGNQHIDLKAYLENVWGKDFRIYLPSATLMWSLGYFERYTSVNDGYLLTQKAFALLEEPTHSSVFISYRRAMSSAFALLLKTSLQKEGIDAFIDMQNLIPGEQWDAALQREIASNDAFVCLLAPGGLGTKQEPSYVVQELTWALNRANTEQNFPVIPVWHNDYDPLPDKVEFPDLADFLSKNHAIIVEKENVLQYKGAIEQLTQYLKT